MSIRVALIGNMNNNHFALMRYLRDFGLDAHLLMYSNELEHFMPQCDTWNWEKWAPFVHQLSFSNGGLDLVFSRKNKIINELGDFDFSIGNGISPVLFMKTGRVLDLFLPYSEGVEFIVRYKFNWKKIKSSVFALVKKILMELALKTSVKEIVTANLHQHSQKTYQRLNLSPINMPLPMFYPEPSPKTFCLPDNVRYLVSRMKSSSLVVFSHVSHIWKNLPVSHFMGGVGKRNNWLIQGFSEYIHSSSDQHALLCLFEYGIDVVESKRLIKKLNIENQVIWFPQMIRREIMLLLPYADLGGSEFAEMYWGGCGWEFLASGVPMLHQLIDAKKYITDEIPLPPFFNVNSPEDICQILLENDRASLKKMGNKCREWFNTYQGRSLAKRYVNLIERNVAQTDSRSYENY